MCGMSVYAVSVLGVLSRCVCRQCVIISGVEAELQRGRSEKLKQDTQHKKQEEGRFLLQHKLMVLADANFCNNVHKHRHTVHKNIVKYA